MNTEDGIKTKAAIRLDTERSYFEWGNGMQVIRRGKGEVAMTEGELARFFGVTWRKVNGRLRTITEELDSVEAHLFRKHVCSELMRPRNALTPIIIYGKDVNN